MSLFLQIKNNPTTLQANAQAHMLWIHCNITNDKHSRLNRDVRKPKIEPFMFCIIELKILCLNSHRYFQKISYDMYHSV